MSSVHSSILNHRLTGGHLIGLGVTSPANAAYFSSYTAPTSSATGIVNIQGSVFEFQTPANAEAAIITAFGGTATTIAAGQFFEDMGDRYVFTSKGMVIAIFAKVRRLNNIDFEGDRVSAYTCIWTGAQGGPSAPTTPTQEMVVGVARL